MRKIKVVVLLVRQLQHGFTKNDKVSPNLTVAHKSLDVRYTVFSTIANFVSEMTLGQVVTLPSGQVVTLSLWSR